MVSENKKVFIAGHQGMVGSAILRNLERRGGFNIVTAGRDELDLTNQKQVHEFFSDHRVSKVILAAAKVGGIQANNCYPAEFIYQNLMIEANVIHASYVTGVDQLLFLGSSCIYPKLARQPIVEEELLAGKLEETNEPYAIAKIAGIKLCESYNRQFGCDYRSVMPTNLYGPGDSFHPENSHVIPALMRRFHEAVLAGDDGVTIWGTGSPRREFLHVDDMANACVHIICLDEDSYAKCTQPMLSHINVGSGVDFSIRELAEKMAEVTGFQGVLVFDCTKPDGTPRKLLDVSRIESLGWRATIALDAGLRDTYQWFKGNIVSLRG